MSKPDVYIIEFSEGELAELLTIIQFECENNQFYADYYQRLCQKIQKQVHYQLANQPFRCAVCNLRNKIRAEIELT
jgi:hypothetical protein